jgi:hypothetical protein
VSLSGTMSIGPLNKGYISLGTNSRCVIPVVVPRSGIIDNITIRVTRPSGSGSAFAYLYIKDKDENIADSSASITLIQSTTIGTSQQSLVNNGLNQTITEEDFVWVEIENNDSTYTLYVGAIGIRVEGSTINEFR